MVPGLKARVNIDGVILTFISPGDKLESCYQHKRPVLVKL
jgi:hypothetical protein